MQTEEILIKAPDDVESALRCVSENKEYLLESLEHAGHCVALGLPIFSGVSWGVGQVFHQLSRSVFEIHTKSVLEANHDREHQLARIAFLHTLISEI